MPLLHQLQAVEQGERQTTVGALMEIERRITEYLRADMWSAVAFARILSPNWKFHSSWDGSSDIEEPVLFHYMREHLHRYETLLALTTEGPQMTWAGAIRYAFDSVIPQRRQTLLAAARENVELLPD